MIVTNHNHSFLEEFHTTADTTEQVLEEKQICIAVSLDMLKNFDRLLREGLEYKLGSLPPVETILRVKFEDDYSGTKQLNADVPQSKVLGPILDLLYTSDILIIEDIVFGTFADETVIRSRGNIFKGTAFKTRSALDRKSIWTREYRINLIVAQIDI